MADTIENTFIAISGLQLYVRYTKSSTPSETVTLVLSPFAEEMNKSRHLSCQLMNSLLLHGHDSFFHDPWGTGDSEADLDVASATIWQQHLFLIIEHLKTHGYRRLNIVASRYGSLQLFDLLSAIELPLQLDKIVLWQPYLQTTSFLQQFLRLKIAEQMAKGTKTSQKELERQLAEGEIVEVAGYPITQQFVCSIQALKDLTHLPVRYQNTPLLWIDTSMRLNISPTSENGLALLSQHFAAEFIQVQGAAWWNASELVQNPELIAQTVEFLTGKKV